MSGSSNRWIQKDRVLCLGLGATNKGNSDGVMIKNLLKCQKLGKHDDKNDAKNLDL